jgi:hypothetical protein
MTGPLFLKWSLPLELRAPVPLYAKEDARQPVRVPRNEQLSHVR